MNGRRTSLIIILSFLLFFSIFTQSNLPSRQNRAIQTSLVKQRRRNIFGRSENSGTIGINSQLPRVRKSVAINSLSTGRSLKSLVNNTIRGLEAKYLQHVNTYKVLNTSVSIVDSSTFASFKSKYNVTGNGTAKFPYVIQNLLINSSSDLGFSSSYRVFYVLRNIVVFGSLSFNNGYSTSLGGLTLDNVFVRTRSSNLNLIASSFTNVTIVNSVFISNSGGNINLHYNSVNFLKNNTLILERGGTNTYSTQLALTGNLWTTGTYQQKNSTDLVKDSTFLSRTSPAMVLSTTNFTLDNNVVYIDPIPSTSGLNIQPLTNGTVTIKGLVLNNFGTSLPMGIYLGRVIMPNGTFYTPVVNMSDVLIYNTAVGLYMDGLYPRLYKIHVNNSTISAFHIHHTMGGVTTSNITVINSNIGVTFSSVSNLTLSGFNMTDVGLGFYNEGFTSNVSVSKSVYIRLGWASMDAGGKEGTVKVMHSTFFNYYHRGLIISSDANLLQQKQKYGWAGSGTNIDPIIIKDTGVFNHKSIGVHIFNTTLHFVLRDIAFNQSYTIDPLIGVTNSTGSIRFKNITATVKYETVRRLNGIKILNSSNVEFLNSTFYTPYASFPTLTLLNIQNSGKINLLYSNFTNGNIASEILSSQNIVFNHTLIRSSKTAISAKDSTYLKFVNNIQIGSSTTFIPVQDVISPKLFGSGPKSQGYVFNNVSDSSMFNNQGMYLNKVLDVTIGTNNTIEHNFYSNMTYFATFDAASFTKIINNTILNLEFQGLQLTSTTSSSYNFTIYGNYFIGTSPFSQLACDEGLNNTWYRPSYGNYWSNLQPSATNYSIPCATKTYDLYPIQLIYKNITLIQEFGKSTYNVSITSINRQRITAVYANYQNFTLVSQKYINPSDTVQVNIYSLNHLQVGEYSVKLQVYFQFGLQTNRTIKIIIRDTTPPQIIKGPSNLILNGTTATEHIQLNWTEFDLSPFNSSLYQNGSVTAHNTFPANQTTGLFISYHLNVGYYVFNFSVTDLYSNSAFQVFTVHVSQYTLPPSATSTHPPSSSSSKTPTTNPKTTVATPTKSQSPSSTNQGGFGQLIFILISGLGLSVIFYYLSKRRF